MATRPETLFRTRVLKELHRIPHVFVETVSQISKVGSPDLLICVGGKFLAWELKTEQGKATKLQLHVGTMIEQAGGTFKVVRPSDLEHHLEAVKLQSTRYANELRGETE